MLLGIERAAIAQTNDRRVAETGMGVAYGRPFSDNDGVVSLDRKKWRPKDARLAAHHEMLLELRDKVWAHSSADTEHRMLRHIAVGEFGNTQEAWANQWTAPDDLPLALDLVEIQIERARMEGDAIEQRLRVIRARPPAGSTEHLRRISGGCSRGLSASRKPNAVQSIQVEHVVSSMPCSSNDRTRT